MGTYKKFKFSPIQPCETERMTEDGAEGTRRGELEEEEQDEEKHEDKGSIKP
jgi:hypothetical protein